MMRAPSAPPPDLAAATHLYHAVRARVARELPRRSRDDAGAHVATVAAALTREVLASGGRAEDVDAGAVHRTLERCIERDPSVLWHLFMATLSTELTRTLPGADRSGSANEARAEDISNGVIERHPGGLALWERWRAGERSGRFVPWLRECLHNAVIDRLRVQRDQAPFLTPHVPAADTRPGVDAPGVVLSSTARPDGRLAQVRRAASRAEAIRLLEQAAARDPNAALALQFYTWLRAWDGDDWGSHAAFAREAGVNPNTLATALRRARRTLDRALPQAHRRQVYTTSTGL